MVDNRCKSRFEEIIHDKNNLESPNLVRKKELAIIVLKQLEEERTEHIDRHGDLTDFSFDEELFKAIFENEDHHKYN